MARAAFPEYLILGAGALGRLWAGYLPAGTTGFVPRPAAAVASGAECHYELVASYGETRRVSVPWHQPVAAHPYQALLVTTKAPDSLNALTQVATRVSASVPVVLFQNGLGSQQDVAAAFPHRPVLAASTTEGANQPEPGRLIHAGQGQTRVGALNAAGGESLDAVVSLLAGSGLNVQSVPDINHWLWQKLVVNAGINPYTALLDCPNGDIVNAPLFQRTINGLCEELAALLSHEGYPANAPILRSHIETVARATASNTSSMRSDMLQGRNTEIDYINGYVVKRARVFNLAVPVNQMLTEQVKTLAGTGEPGMPG